MKANVIAKLSGFVAAMALSENVTIGNATGRIQKIEREDGSGNRFIITFDSGRAVYLDMSDMDYSHVTTGDGASVWHL